MDVAINTDDQDEEGIKLYVGSTTIVTVWDAQSPEVEMTIAQRIKEALER